jgi:molybdopterin molybdotransferase
MKENLHSEGFRNVAKVEVALETLFEAGVRRGPKAERISVHDSLGRILAEDIVNTRFVPQVDKSTMDGYAVRSEDVKGASEENQVALKIVGESRIGEVCRVTIRAGEAVAVATGSMIPSGADAVVMVEKTGILPGQKVAVRAAGNSRQNILGKGEDVSPGTIVLRKGHRVRPQDIGILLALGLRRVPVAKRPRVGIISTGNELGDFSKKGNVAKVVDVNRPILMAMVEEAGGFPVDLGIARDRELDIIGKLRKGVGSCDIVLISAGSSVGRRDLVPKCINAIGKPGMLVHGIAMRPALPTGLAIVRGKPIMSLPGFPVSTMFAFRTMGRPLIARSLGAKEAIEPVVKATLKGRIIGSPGYRTFVRVVLHRTEEGLVAEPLKSQRSSELMSMVSADGIVTVPEQIAAYEDGQVVDVSVIGEVPT